MDGVEVSRDLWPAIDEFPLAPPPENVMPDFANPRLVGFHSYTIACAMSMALVIIMATLRIYAKVKLIKKTTVDDYLFYATLPFLLYLGAAGICIDYGGAYGHHMWELQIKRFRYDTLLLIFLNCFMVPITTWLVKTTLLSLLFTAFRPVNWLRHCIYIGIGVTSCYYLAVLIINCVACRPVDGFDRIALLMATFTKDCSAMDGMVQKASLSSGVFSVLTDFYILLLPIPVVAKLKLSKEKRIGVWLMLSAGGLACIASIMCLVYRVRLNYSQDTTVDVIPILSTNMIELCIGISISCVAPASKLIRHVRKTRRAQTISSTSPSGSEPQGRSTNTRQISRFFEMPSSIGSTRSSCMTQVDDHAQVQNSVSTQNLAPKHNNQGNTSTENFTIDPERQQQDYCIEDDIQLWRSSRATTSWLNLDPPYHR